jgi:hypothetical protein
MGAWNDYMGPLIYINQSDLFNQSRFGEPDATLNQVGIKGISILDGHTIVTIPIV